MTTHTYPAKQTAILLTDPYNDFMTPGGKLYDAIKDVATANNMFAHLRQILDASRAAGIQVFILPHHRAHEGDYKGWKNANPSQKHSHEIQAFAADTWGGEWSEEFGPKAGDVIIQEHWSFSGFANTDLDEQLKQRGIQNIICVGMIANACIESTARYGMELGYHVTLVKDATSAFSAEAMHISHEVNAPFFAHAILTTAELLAQLPSSAIAYNDCP
ncbi:isochorismatase family cysteine hydrolase [Pseudomonas sp. NA-150]|uniref:isochorismatase family cysteine hydrolase n=1 Tax=Pseudomonas sp. NA-150 TaxID=3367525 RepID=UPI0037CCAA7F